MVCAPTSGLALDYLVTTGTDTGEFFTGNGIGTTGDLRYCIAQANFNPGSTIHVAMAVNPARMFPPILSGMTLYHSTGTALVGAGVERLFFIDAPGATVIIQNLDLQNGRAKGGNGGVGGGGGGAGMGGAIFVNAGHLVLDGVTFTNGSVVGGTGGAATGAGDAGGGGLGGNGATNRGGGGGLFGHGGNGATNTIGDLVSGGGGGIIGNGAMGQIIGNVAREGGGGGGTVSATTRAGAGGGGNGGFGNTLPTAGGLYGGGGGCANIQQDGAAGGKFGGGGAASRQTARDGGAGGDFGGGGSGGVSRFQNDLSRGGNGGYGGGGASGGTEAGAAGYGGGAGGFGNGGSPSGSLGGSGGSAFGGAVYVRGTTGGSLEVRNTSVPAIPLTAGAGGVKEPGSGVSSSAGTPGTVAGSGLYIHTGSLVFTSDDSQTIGGGIASGVEGIDVQKNGNGNLIFSAAHTYTGGTTVNYGTLIFAASGNLGATSNFLATYLSGTVDLRGTSQSVGPIFGTNGGKILNNNSNSISTLTIGSGDANGDFEGFLQDGLGTLALKKMGTGTQILRHANTHTGATDVLGGALVLDTSFSNGPLIPAGSTLTVNNATVRLTGTAYNALGQGPVILQSGGILSAEATTQNAHTLGLLTLQGGTLTGVNPDAQFGNFILANEVTATGNLTSTLSAPVVQLRGQRTMNVADGAAATDLTISSVLANNAFNADPGGLLKTGTGTLALTAANTYTGGTTINAGTLVAAKPGQYATFAAGSTVTVNTGGTLLCAGSDSLGYYDGSAKVVINAGGIVTTDGQSGQNTWLNDLTMQGGVLTSPASGGSFLLAGPVKTLASATTATISAKNLAIYAGYAAPVSFDVPAGTVPSGTDLSISSVISGGGAEPLIKKGNGVLLLSGANTYQGGTRLEGGTIAFSHPDALGTGPITFGLGTLRFVGIHPDVSARFTATGVGNPFRIDTNGQNVTFASPLIGGGNLGKSGLGTLTLTGANAYTGDTNINAGTVSFTQATLADASAVSIAAGATLNLAFAGTDTVNRLTIGGVQQIAGVYKAVGNPALGTATAAITGTGMIRVLSSPAGNDYGVWTAATGVAGSITDDDDRDGAINRFEYAFGLTPTSASSLNPVSIPAGAAVGQLNYTRRTASLSGLTYSVRTSGNLSLWTTDTTATQTIISTVGSIETVRVTLSPALLTNGKLFVVIRTNE